MAGSRLDFHPSGESSQQPFDLYDFCEQFAGLIAASEAEVACQEHMAFQLGSGSEGDGQEMAELPHATPPTPLREVGHNGHG